LLDQALLKIGAIVVPIYETDSIEQIEHIINDAQVAAVFVEDYTLFEKVNHLKPNLKSLKTIRVISEGAVESLIKIGSTKNISDEKLQKISDSVKRSDVATIVYTSGSTGTPKGVVLSHLSFIYLVLSGFQAEGNIIKTLDTKVLLFLPVAHVLARFLSFVSLYGTATLAIGDGMKNLMSDFKQIKPTYVVGVPRVYEKIYNTASQQAGRGLKKKVFAKAANTAIEYAEAIEGDILSRADKYKVKYKLKSEYAVYDKMVFAKIRKVLGGEVRQLICGAAPVGEKLVKFFTGTGLQVIEGFGMTELCGMSTGNRTWCNKLGTIGIPMPGVYAKISDDGELLFKTLSQMDQYNNLDDETAETLIDGWIHTGDLAEIDDKGYIKITGRKKDMLITAGGKNMMPVPLEEIVKTSEIIADACVVAEQKPFVSILITINIPDLNIWLQNQKLKPVKDVSEIKDDPVVTNEIMKVIDEANNTVSRAESIRKFIILDEPFTVENGCSTPSMKIVRTKIYKHYADIIDKELYTKKQY
ncbi:MAG: AMP-dependent synthetase/ligase, partial [Bifidobacteriaceae bacterium]|nr:AMP-dependent synthetase/ligase [Bifidobacteriaceae bacterium]